MALFYATAKDENEKSYIIYQNEIFKDRMTAVEEAERICKREKWILDGVRMVNGSSSFNANVTKE